MKKYIEELQKLIPQDRNICESNISKILYDICNGINIKDIFRSDMMFASIVALIKMLYKDEKIRIHNGMIYSKSELGCHHYRCNNVLRTDLYLKKELITKEIFDNRKKRPNLSYYQSYNTFDSLKRRLSLMQQFNDVTNKKIAFLGDDELFSVFYALNSESYKRILVLDADISVLNEIKNYSHKYNLNIETRNFDVFNENYFESEFDVFFASGLKNLAGLLLFIFTASKFLTPNELIGGYFTYYPYVTSLDDIQKEHDNYNLSLQKKLIEHGFFIEHLSVCDEIKVSDSMCEKVLEWIFESTEWLISNDRRFMSNVIGIEEIASDPLFPYFSICPIHIVKVKRYFDNAEQISKYIKVAKRLNV